MRINSSKYIIKCLIGSIVTISIISCRFGIDGMKAKESDFTKKYKSLVDDYASDSDIFSIKEIEFGDTDKNNYCGLWEGVWASVTIQLHNTTSDNMKLWIDGYSSFAGYYISDTIPLIDWNYYEVALGSSEKYKLDISTSAPFDFSGIFDFEPLFGYKEDYVDDMIRLWADMKIVYTPDFTRLENPVDSVFYYRKPTLVKPSRDVKVTVVNNKDNVLEYWWRRNIKKEELPFVARYKELETRYNRISD